MSMQGFINETEMRDELNNKRILDLNHNLKTFILDIFSLSSSDKNLNKLVRCIKRGGQKKGDLEIIVDDISKVISVKMGTGNSVHQEPVNDFIKYLSNNFKINEEVSNCIRLFIWGDGTLDGTGKNKNRISAITFSKTYPKEIKKIQEYFDKIKKNLIERFVFNGRDNNLSIDYIYYGNKIEGKWISSHILLDWFLDDKNKSSGAISVGALTFQAWNRNINGGDKSEKKRGVIQLKWGTMGYDIITIKT